MSTIRSPHVETPDQLIDRILAAAKIEDVLDVKDADAQRKEILIQIHPDKCHHPKAGDASARLGELFTLFKDGKLYKDESGEFRTNGYFVKFTGDEDLLRKSKRNFDAIVSRGNAHLNKYLPKSYTLNGSTLVGEFDKRAIPLSGLTLPQEHVNWVLSRLLEFSAMLESAGYVHCGLNPDSVFIMPENHGIQVISFYHVTPVNGRVRTLCGTNNYLYWYPISLLTDKLAKTGIDIETSKRIGAYLLGDRSGMGVVLKKTANLDFVEFLLTQHAVGKDTFVDYRKMIDKNFPKKFHILNI